MIFGYHTKNKTTNFMKCFLYAKEKKVCHQNNLNDTIIIFKKSTFSGLKHELE